jgi:predicted nucleic acid-binding protein
MTSTSVEFCDTNIIVYAYDRSAGEKRQVAMALLDRLWNARAGAVSIQVLQEVFVTLTRKCQPPLTPADARAIVADISTWRVVEPTTLDVLEAIDTAARWQISFWDGMLLVSARKVRASVVWSEDLTDGQDYGGVVVRNPLSPHRLA